MCTPFVTELLATHTRSVAYQLPRANWNSIGVWMFRRVILPILHHNPHPGFFNKIPSHGVFLFCKTKHLCHDQCNACRLGPNAYDVKMTLWMIKHYRLSNNFSILDMISRTSKNLIKFHNLTILTRIFKLMSLHAFTHKGIILNTSSIT